MFYTFNNHLYGKNGAFIGSAHIDFTRYLTLLQTSGGSITADKLSGKYGDEITLSSTSNPHFNFNGYSITGATLTGDKFKFESSDVTAKGNFIQDPIRSLSILSSVGGSITANKMSGYDNDIVTLSNTANTAYNFTRYDLTGATLTANQFKFNGSDVTAKGVFTQKPTRTVTINQQTGGTIQATPTTGYDGTVVTLSNTANAGYTFNKYNITGATLTGNKFNFNGSDVIAEGNFVQEYDPYNPLNLPPNTIRVRTSDERVPFKDTYTTYETATLVSGTSDVYDVYKSGTSFKQLLKNSYNVVEVLGANTTGITNMNGMFMNCNLLTTVPLFDTSSVTDMNDMFCNCQALPSVPLFDTSNVTDMNDMFQMCKSLQSVPLLDTSKVTNMWAMFDYCLALRYVPLLDTSKVTNMNMMFFNCTSLINVPLFDTSKVTDVGLMFYNCTSVQSGALALYQQASTQANPPSNHDRTFRDCGSNTQTGSAELAQIPSSWK